MKIAELRQKSEAELKKLLAAQQEKMQEGKFQLAAGKIKNVRALRATKTLIAQIHTIRNEKQRDHA